MTGAPTRFTSAQPKLFWSFPLYRDGRSRLGVPVGVGLRVTAPPRGFLPCRGLVQIVPTLASYLDERLTA